MLYKEIILKIILISFSPNEIRKTIKEIDPKNKDYTQIKIHTREQRQQCSSYSSVIIIHQPIYNNLCENCNKNQNFRVKIVIFAIVFFPSIGPQYEHKPRERNANYSVGFLLLAGNQYD